MLEVRAFNTRSHHGWYRRGLHQQRQQRRRSCCDVVSIPKSDSSPRSVYEAITLGCQIFATNLECFDWIPTELKSKFIFSSSNLTKDSYQLLNAIENFDNHRKLSLKKKYPQFYNSLDYYFIAKTYLKTFKKVMKDNC